GVFTGDPPQLAASKTGSRLVHGRAAAGGWSQHRFARRRENQATAALRAAADTALAVLGPYQGRLDAVVLGGDRRARGRGGAEAGGARPGAGPVPRVGGRALPPRPRPRAGGPEGPPAPVPRDPDPAPRAGPAVIELAVTRGRAGPTGCRRCRGTPRRGR